MRQKKNGIVKFKRVESVEVIKLTDRQRINELCPDGFVYDLEIEDNHNYLAENILVHNCGAFPKPNKINHLIKQKYSHLPMIFLSGTPNPESYSQIYHQFWVSDYSPFKEPNFYKWAKTYVRVKDRHLGYAVVKDYSDGIKELINPVIEPYLLTYTQEQAGFTTEVKENILTVKMNDITYKLASKLKKDLFIVSKDGSEVIADTAVKLMQKLHQIYSGTVLFEDGSYRIFDTSKAEFIKERFKGKRLGIFYKFKAEYDLLKQTFGDDLTNELESFNNGVKHIALQFQSGKEGISLSNADVLIAYNIDFSATTYFQFKDRMTTFDRKENNLFWLFSDGGIEEKIYNQVMNKKNFTLNVFKRYYDIPTRNNQIL